MVTEVKSGDSGDSWWQWSLVVVVIDDSGGDSDV